MPGVNMELAKGLRTRSGLVHSTEILEGRITGHQCYDRYIEEFSRFCPISRVLLIVVRKVDDLQQSNQNQILMSV